MGVKRHRNKLIINTNHVEEYADKTNIRPKTRKNYRTILNQFLKDFGKVLEIKQEKRNRIDYVESKIDFNSVIKFNKWANTLVKGNENIRVVKGFFNFLATKNPELKPILRDWADYLKWEGKRKVKKLYVVEGEKQAIDMEDYYAHLTMLYQWGLNDNPRYSIRAIGATLLSATTGLRPYEIYRLTIEKLSRALETGYFILESHEAKTHVERVIPIHPKIKDWIRTALELCKTRPFPESEVNKWFRKAGSEIKLEQFRPFFVKISPLVCGMDEVIRIAITGHDEHIFTKEAEILNKQDVSEIYRKYTPQAIVDHYLSTFAVKFLPLPAEVQLSKLLGEWANKPSHSQTQAEK